MAAEPRLAALRRHLTFVIIAALVPAVLLAMLIVGYDYYAQERDREVRDSLATARAMAASVDAQLKGVESALFGLASSPYLAGEDPAPFHAQARATLADQQFINIVLLDPALQQKLNTLRPFGEPLPSSGAPQQLGEVVRTGRPVITDLFPGPVAKEPLIAVGVPVRHDGRVRYVLAAGVTPARLAAILRQQQLPNGWIGVIFDRSGTIVARTHEAERFIGVKAVAPLVQAAAKAREGVVEASTLEGISVVTVFSHSPVSGWTVAIGIPTSYFNTHLLYSLGRLFVVAFIMLAVAIAVAVLLIRRAAG